MKSSGLFRLGRDAEIRSLPTGDQVVELALAYFPRVARSNAP